MPERAEREHSVPGFGGRDGGFSNTRDGQSALKLHAGIAVIATLLCLFVTGIYVYLDVLILAIIFGVIALGCIAALIWALRRLRLDGPR